MGRAPSPAYLSRTQLLPRAFPEKFQWPGAMSSLTVARQRGICTRFPILLKARRTREPLLKQDESKSRQGECQSHDLESFRRSSAVIPNGRAAASEKDRTMRVLLQPVKFVPPQKQSIECALRTAPEAQSDVGRSAARRLRARDGKISGCRCDCSRTHFSTRVNYIADMISRSHSSSTA